MAPEDLDDGRVTFEDAKADPIDPVCGMDIDANDSAVLTTQRGEKTFYFCSPACKEQFDSNPKEFGAG